MGIKKFYILFIIIITFSTTTYAQEETQEETEYGFNKGDFFVAGALEYGGFISNQTTGDNSLSLAPSIGYFISENISLGIQSEFLVIKPDDFSLNSTSVGINGRYHFMPKQRFNVFGELALDYTHQNRDSFFRGFNEEIKSISATGSIGMNFFITKNIALFTKFDLIEFSNSQYESNDIFFSERNSKINQNSIKIGPENLNLGVMFKF